MMGVSKAFWNASSAWFRAHKAAQAKARAEGRSPDTAGAKEARWVQRGAKYLRARPSLPSQLIRVDPALSQGVLDLMEAMAPQLVGAYDRELGGLAFRAWRQWPVATGLSRSLVSLEYEVQGDGTFVGHLRSRAPYTVFIKGQPHRQLIDRPSREVATRIAEQALQAVAGKR